MKYPPTLKVIEFVKRRRRPPKDKGCSLSLKLWKQYYEILDKQLQGQRTTKKENKLQRKGDAEVNRSLQGIPI